VTIHPTTILSRRRNNFLVLGRATTDLALTKLTLMSSTLRVPEGSRKSALFDKLIDIVGGILASLNKGFITLAGSGGIIRIFLFITALRNSLTVITSLITRVLLRHLLSFSGH
jgi:hypothetical protein